MLSLGRCMRFGELIIDYILLHRLINNVQLLNRIWRLRITWDMATSHTKATSESKGSRLFVR
jgi:hypothetical protein